MFVHPDVLSSLVEDRHRELIAEADRRRRLNAARLWRRTRARTRQQAAARPTLNTAEVGGGGDTLSSCEDCEAVPAR